MLAVVFTVAKIHTLFIRLWMLIWALCAHWCNQSSQIYKSIQFTDIFAHTCVMYSYTGWCICVQPPLWHSAIVSYLILNLPFFIREQKSQPIWNLFTCLHVYICVILCVCKTACMSIFTYRHKHIYIYIYIYAYIYIYIYIGLKEIRLMEAWSMQLLDRFSLHVRTCMQWIQTQQSISRYRQWGNPLATRLLGQARGYIQVYHWRLLGLCATLSGHEHFPSKEPTEDLQEHT